MYYDIHGRRITMEQWASSFGGNRHVAFSRLKNGYEVSTVWLGLDHGFGINSKPLIFETMVFPGNEMQRYSTLEEAKVGHKEMVLEWSKKKLEKSGAEKDR